MSPAQLIDLAGAIADGAPIDWTRVQSPPAATTSDVIVRARIVERVAQLHAALPAADSFSSSLHKSLAGVVLPGEAASSDQLITWDRSPSSSESGAGRLAMSTARTIGG